jgi:hypothetical protein
MANLGITMPSVSTAGIISFALWTLIILLVVGIGILLGWRWWKARRYRDYNVVIWEKDSTGHTHEYYDKGGIFLDKKTGYRLLFLQRLKKGLNPNNVPYITSKDKKGRLIKTIYLRKIGESNYVFCKVEIKEDGTRITSGEEDVNWLYQEMQKVKNTFGIENFWQKNSAIIMWVITMVLVLVLVLSLFNKFTILKDIAEKLDEASEKQLEITTLMYNISQSNNLRPAGSPIIVPGGT